MVNLTQYWAFPSTQIPSFDGAILICETISKKKKFKKQFEIKFQYILLLLFQKKIHLPTQILKHS